MCSIKPTLNLQKRKTYYSKYKIFCFGKQLFFYKNVIYATLLGLYFYISLILKSNMVNIGKYNPHK